MQKGSLKEERHLPRIPSLDDLLLNGPSQNIVCDIIKYLTKKKSINHLNIHLHFHFIYLDGVIFL